MVFDHFSSVVMGLLKMTIVKFEKLAFTMGVFNGGGGHLKRTPQCPYLYPSSIFIAAVKKSPSLC